MGLLLFAEMGRKEKNEPNAWKTPNLEHFETAKDKSFHTRAFQKDMDTWNGHPGVRLAQSKSRQEKKIDSGERLEKSSPALPI